MLQREYKKSLENKRWGKKKKRAGSGKVIERYEEAFVCYGVPTAEDPGGYISLSELMLN
jgi:hypothetical protein